MEILFHGSDGGKAFVADEAKDGVLVGKGGSAGAIEPLCEKGGQLEIGLGLRDGLYIRGAYGFVGILRQQVSQKLEEDVVAHLPAEHVEDHRSLLERHPLELRGEGGN